MSVQIIDEYHFLAFQERCLKEMSRNNEIKVGRWPV